MNNPIKRLKEIAKTDAFDSFAWTGSDLRRLNLIYGWNGSGKTTMSRVFNFLERRTVHIPDLAPIVFQVETPSHAVKETDLATHRLNIRVFNEDFVKDNLAFDNSQAKRIVIIGKANIELQKEIAALETERAEKTREAEDLRKRRAEVSKVDAALTECGREVTKQFGNTPLANHQYYGRSYNKSRVQTKIDEGAISSGNLSSLILASQGDLDAHRETIKTEREKILLSLTPIADFSFLVASANELLGITVSTPDVGDLKADGPLRNWTEVGYQLHKDRTATSCLFCNGVLSDRLMTDLAGFFSDQIANIKAQLGSTLVQLGDLRYSDEEIDSVDSATFFPDLAKDYLASKAEVTAATKAISTAIAAIESSLTDKEGRLHETTAAFNPTPYPTEAVKNANAAMTAIAALVKRHNERVDRKTEEVRAAALAIELHTIASVLMSREYFAKKKVGETLDAQLTPLTASIADLESKVRGKRASLQDALVAIEKINGFLREFFGEGQIYLQATTIGAGEINYSVMSRGKEARHLSEGEKSVLALSYFFIKLEEEGCAKADTTIVVDDPVDSQDGNFLFRTFGLLKRQLSDAGQVVVLTHNYEFFNLVRDWLVSMDRGNESGLYLLSLNKGPTERAVIVEDLPMLLREYKSEYQYLFSLLYQHSQGTKTLASPLVANIGRKVLEYFAGFKWSCKTTEQFTSVVLNRFVGDPNKLKDGTGDFIVKFLHEYSHGQDFSRPVSASTFESGPVTDNILAFIRLADREHYNDLVALCS